MSEEVLSAKGIVKTYKTGSEFLHVLRGIDVMALRGDKIIVTGPSGSGKSTLLHVLGLLDFPDAGELILFNKKIERKNDKYLSFLRSRHIGFVFQYHHLFSDFTAAQNVMIPLVLSGFDEKSAHKKSMEMLSAMGLADRALHRPNQLSGGEAQRVQVARAMALNPDILLLDEPTGNLDEKNAMKLMHLIILLNEKFKTTLIMVTHNKGLEQFFNIHYYIKEGKLHNES